MREIITFGSVCSGIEAAQLAFNAFGLKQMWSSEIAEFPSKVLKFHYPHIPNIGDMTDLPNLILNKKYSAPDVFCGGTPCQAFSLAGWKNGLTDERGKLTMTFIECEILQTLPTNYTECLSDTQRYKSIGNGWTVDVIAHIFKGLR